MQPLEDVLFFRVSGSRERDDRSIRIARSAMNYDLARDARLV